MRLATFLLALAFSAFAGAAHAQVVTLNKGGFVLTYDCSIHSATRYEYTLVADTGSAARPSSFYRDPDLPAGCLGQTSTSSYASVQSGYDRGHLVTSNHMDYDATYIRRANYMTNIVPQVSSFNQGIWVKAENVAECYRDIAPVDVYGGVVYGDASNDYFLASHGIPTPEFFWKTIITKDPNTGTAKAISWIIPNETGLGSLDSYLVTIADLEELLGASYVAINAPASLKNMLPSTSWPLPSGCDLG
ncbi:DNA/RNA non-specific endonuclease [Stenotrophomonas sp. NA06056]|uniref:DNA/RNA non-specific endonuclease n=1 Tax=Stenotrophomonas sp. NA06056 TaxID=2742129 RepID=UPI00158E402C|nr:DNA/RNA non-specific endonuclease [Stenotrophomonas sp. NA06056]QKW56750.1 DNA/RNA non-specific endonuclease [Stenotrophomonas sp. NA06056]